MEVDQFFREGRSLEEQAFSFAFQRKEEETAFLLSQKDHPLIKRFFQDLQSTAKHIFDLNKKSYEDIFFGPVYSSEEYAIEVSLSLLKNGSTDLTFPEMFGSNVSIPKTYAILRKQGLFRFSSYYDMELTSDHIHALDEKFSAQSEEVQTVKKTTQLTSLEEFILETERQYPYITSPIIPAIGTATIIEIDPQEFTEKHFVNILLGLSVYCRDQKIDSKYVEDKYIDTKALYFDHDQFDHLSTFIQRTEKYTIIVTRNTMHSKVRAGAIPGRINASFVPIGINTWLKNYFQDYPVRTETATGTPEKKLLVEKVKSSTFLKENLGRISSELKDGGLPRLISHIINAPQGMHIELYDIQTDSNGIMYPTGEVNYSAEGKIPTDSDPQTKEIHFPLSHLYQLTHYPESYVPYLGELEFISEMLEQARNNDMVLFGNDELKHVKRLQGIHQELKKAHTDLDDFIDVTHAAPSPKEEYPPEAFEMMPELQREQEWFDKYYEGPSKILSIVHKSIDSIFNNLSTEQQEILLPPISHRDLYGSEEKYTFLYNSIMQQLPTTIMMQSLHPHPETLQLLESILEIKRIQEESFLLQRPENPEFTSEHRSRYGENTPKYLT